LKDARYGKPEVDILFVGIDKILRSHYEFCTAY